MGLRRRSSLVWGTLRFFSGAPALEIGIYHHCSGKIDGKHWREFQSLEDFAWACTCFLKKLEKVSLVLACGPVLDKGDREWEPYIPQRHMQLGFEETFFLAKQPRVSWFAVGFSSWDWAGLWFWRESLALWVVVGLCEGCGRSGGWLSTNQSVSSLILESEDHTQLLCICCINIGLIGLFSPPFCLLEFHVVLAILDLSLLSTWFTDVYQYTWLLTWICF